MFWQNKYSKLEHTRVGIQISIYRHLESVAEISATGAESLCKFTFLLVLGVDPFESNAFDIISILFAVHIHRYTYTISAFRTDDVVWVNNKMLCSDSRCNGDLCETENSSFWSLKNTKRNNEQWISIFYCFEVNFCFGKKNPELGNGRFNHVKCFRVGFLHFGIH